MHMRQSPYQLHPQQFLSSSSSFYIMLHMCILWCVSNFFAHEKKTYSEKYMNGRLYCCYQNSPYQLCPHILVFMFKNYIPHRTDRQTDRHTDRYTHTHTHTHTHMYIITRIFQSFYSHMKIKSTRGLAN